MANALLSRSPGIQHLQKLLSMGERSLPLQFDQPRRGTGLQSRTRHIQGLYPSASVTIQAMSASIKHLSRIPKYTQGFGRRSLIKA